MSEASFDVRRAHRWFAVELNNLAWELVEANDRSAAETERMIHCAHGACFHWLEVGDLLNHLRAQCLLATAYAKAGLAESALRHGERCLILSREAGQTQTAFDRATAHGCASAAHLAVGRIAEARSEHQLARSAAAGLAEPSEKLLFAKLYPEP
jgi:hypothetical protein